MNIAEKILKECFVDVSDPLEQCAIEKAMEKIAWEAVRASIEDTHIKLTGLFHDGTEPFDDTNLRKWFEQWYIKNIVDKVNELTQKDK